MTTTPVIPLDAGRRRIVRLGFLGMLFIVLGCVIVVLNPTDLVVNNMLSMNEGSYLHRLWKKPPLEVFISIYVFNVTNADAFMRGKEKMKVEELGPYVYQEFLENHNSTFNANGTLSFTPIRRQVFVPERSVGDPRHDLIIVPNIAYLGVASAAYRMSAWASIAVAAALKPLGMSPFLNITVHDLLWGYEDPLVQVASTLLPNIIHFKKIGILDRMFDDGFDTVTINLPEAVQKLRKTKIVADVSEEELDSVEEEYFAGDALQIAAEEEAEETDDPIRNYSIDLWNGSPGLAHWGYVGKDHWDAERRNTPCNTLQGSYACGRHFSEAQFEARNGSPREMRLDAVPDRNIVRRTIDPEDPLDAVCRLCLERIKSDCHLIHPVWPAPEVPSAKDIEEVFGVVVPKNDSMPRLICLTCVTKVNYVMRIRNQYRKNDAIFTKKWTPKKETVKSPAKTRSENDRRSAEQDSITVIPHSSIQGQMKSHPSTSEALLTESHTSGQSLAEVAPVNHTPKIAAVASYGKNPVAASSSSIDPASERVLSNAYGELVYIQKGNTYQRFQIISSNQIGLSCEREEVVHTSTDCRVLPSDPGDEVEILYTDGNTEIPADAKLVKLEFEPALDFGNLQADDTHLLVEELEELPEKRPRIDKPFRYDQVKDEPGED